MSRLVQLRGGGVGFALLLMAGPTFCLVVKFREGLISGSVETNEKVLHLGKCVQVGPAKGGMVWF